MEAALNNRINENYWVAKLDGKPAFNLKPNNIRTTRQAVIPKSALSYFNEVTNNNNLAKFTLITSLYAFLLKKFFIDFDGTIYLNSNWNQKITKPVVSILGLNEEISLKEHIGAVKREVQICLKHSDYRTDRLLEKLEKPLSSFSRFGLISSETTRPKRYGLLLELSLMDNDEIAFSFVYNKAYMQPFIANQLKKKLRKLIVGLRNLIGTSLSEIEILDKKEINQLLLEFNDTEVAYPKTKTIIDLFEEQVDKSPEDIAIINKNHTLTYFELNAKANQLGHYLRCKYNIKPNDAVGLRVNRDEFMLIAIFGILKTGAAYVPIDPNYPEKRIQYIENDTQCKVIIDSFEMEAFLSSLDEYSITNSKIDTKSENLAYIIYTSGTTGNPKGVMIENRSLVNRLFWMQKVCPLSKGDTIIQKTTYSFDVSVWEIFWWSIYGAKVSVPSVGVEKDPELLIQNIYQSKVTILHFVPSMLSIFLVFLEENPKKKEKLISLRQVFVSGEALKESQKEKFLKNLPKVKLMNLYGPTEASIDVSYFDCIGKLKYDCLPIGKPIDNIKLLILDETHKLLPIGATGKLFISGVGLSRGYLNKPELTKEKFIDNPYLFNSKMYDTGDLARWLPDGNIEFLGRMDSQVKFKGIRIELKEIEKTLISFSEINQAIVEVKSFKGNDVLVAYLVFANRLDKKTLRLRMLEVLPEYMLPSFYLELKSMPLTSNGKLDRNSLPDIKEEYITQHYIEPKNEAQKELAKIWQDVLGVNKIGISDNFFELGGHSLMVVQIINRIVKKLDKTISVKDFLSLATIEQIEPKLKQKKYHDISVSREFEEIII